MSYNPVEGRWTARDPIGFEGGDLDLYQFAGNDPVNRTDPEGLQWRLDMYDHGRPHLQNGNMRWNAHTLEPMEFMGKTPPFLTSKDLEEIRKAGLWDKLRKQVPDSILSQVAEEMLATLKQNKCRDLSKKSAKEITNRALRLVGPAVVFAFLASDYAEGGWEQAAKNAVIPGDLIEDLALKAYERSKADFDAYIDSQNKLIYVRRLLGAGFTQDEAERIAGGGSP